MSDLRPRTHAERDAVVDSVARYVSLPGADAAFVTATARLFESPRAAYVAAREAHRAATAAAAAAADAAKAADATFDVALRRWTRSVVDGDGRSRAAELAGCVGGLLPSRIVRLAYGDEVTHARTLLQQAQARPWLSGDPAARVALDQATCALETAVRDEADAFRRRLEAGVHLKVATTELDRAYGRLRRWIRAMVGDAELVRVLPQFTRTPAASRDDAA